MRTNFFLPSIIASAFAGALALLAAKPADFSNAQIDEIWTQLWKSDDPKIQEPKVDKLSEKVVLERMTGKWTVMFGVIPDRLTILLNTNRLVTVSGQKNGKDWKKTGEWRVVSDRLILFLEQDDLPSFIFSARDHDYIFDPWAKTMKSELKQEK
jgi:hypothetical protein